MLLKRLGVVCRMRARRKIGFIMVLCVAGSAGAQLDRKGPVLVSIRQPATPFNVAKPIKIQIDITNCTQKKITYSERHDGKFSGEVYKLELTFNDGRPVPRWENDKPSDRNWFWGGGTIVVIEPGQSLKRDVYVNSVFDIKEPGTYMVKAYFLGESISASEPIKIEVVSSDIPR